MIFQIPRTGVLKFEIVAPNTTSSLPVRRATNIARAARIRDGAVTLESTIADATINLLKVSFDRGQYI